MIDIEQALKDFPVITLDAGKTLLTQGESSDSIYFLIDGDVEVVRDGIEIARTSDKGAVFGEMSVILGEEHTATVRCRQDSRFFQIEDPQKFLDSHPEVIWHITQILSRRLAHVNRYLIDIKHKYDDERYMQIVDETLRILRDQR